LAGSDGSTEMLAYALQRRQLQGVPLSQCYFNRLNKLSSHQGKFDLIYFLGNAIAHSADKEEILECLCQTWSALEPHGKVVFDFRGWVFSGEFGQLIEPHRPIMQERQVKLGVLAQKDGERIEMSEICFYKFGRQFIEYRVRAQSTDEFQKSESFTFSYLPFTKSEALEMLVKAGFQSCGITEPQMDYSYLVAFGEKA
jgi:SAM-dependent methyltransferase